MPSARRFSFGPKRYFNLQYLLPVGVTSRYIPRPSAYRSLGFPGEQVALRQATSVRGMFRPSKSRSPTILGEFLQIRTPRTCRMAVDVKGPLRTNFTSYERSKRVDFGGRLEGRLVERAGFEPAEGV